LDIEDNSRNRKQEKGSYDVFEKHDQLTQSKYLSHLDPPEHWWGNQVKGSPWRPKYPLVYTLNPSGSVLIPLM
jgi:hypothetical protein